MGKNKAPDGASRNWHLGCFGYCMALASAQRRDELATCVSHISRTRTSAQEIVALFIRHFILDQLHSFDRRGYLLDAPVEQCLLFERQGFQRGQVDADHAEHI